MNNISAIIVAKDNPPHLFETIQSVEGFVAEIIIIDVGITPEVKDRLDLIPNVMTISINRPIPYVELIREESHQYAHQDYILHLDHDEIVPPGLKEVLQTHYQQYDYISIPRKNLIFNKWIQHSRWWPDYQIRLFKKGKAIWPKEIHSKPTLHGNGWKVEPKEENAILHYNYSSIDEYMSKMVRYAKSEAKEMMDADKKYSLHDAITKGFSEFISRFFASYGYKDGIHGLVLAFLQMFYYFLVYCYVWEGRKYQHEDEKHLIKTTKSFFSQGLFEVNYWLIKQNLTDKIGSVKCKVQNILIKWLE